MPVYTFRNIETQEITEVILKIAELDEYKQNNPHLEKVILNAPGCCDPVTAGVRKPAEGFRDLLKNMKKKNYGSNINDNW